MAKETALRNVAVTATIPGQSNPVISHVTISCGVNGFPSVNLYTFPNEGGSPKAPRSSAVASTIAGLQKATFSTESTANLKVSVTDGNKGSIDFKGFVSNVGYRLGFGSIGYNIDSLHEVALLSSLNTSIYINRDPAYGFRSDLAVASSLSKIFAIILKKIVTSFRVNLPTLYNTDKAIRQSVDDHQAAALAAWYKILSDSEKSTTYSTLDELTKNDKVITNAIQTQVIELYLNSSSDFFQTMMSLCNNFQLLFVPDIIDGNHRFIKISDIVSADGYEPKETPIIQMQFSTGNKGGMPVQGVICRNLPHPNHGFDPNAAKSVYYPGSLPVACTWPNKVTSGGGILLETHLPNWLPINEGAAFASAAITGATKPTYDLETVANKQSSKVIEGNKFTNGALTKIVQEHLRGQYVNFALGSAAAVINVPLDLTWKVGGLYHVLHDEGGVLFKGFLSSLEHSLDLSGSEASCGTTLNFTHIQAGDFVLPNLS